MTPRFYSKWTIFGLTLILSPFFGGILFSYNLREIGKWKLGVLFVIIGMFWTVIFKKITNGFIHDYFLQYILSNIVGSLLLTFLFWDIYFIGYEAYEIKPVWKPLIIFVSICAALLLFQIYASKH